MSRLLCAAFVVFSLLALASLANGDVCGQYNNDCQSCVGIGCGYCGPNRACVNGTVTGPSGNGTIFSCEKGWQFGSCSNCPVYPTCAACNLDDGCVWCETSQSGPQGCQLMGKQSQGCLIAQTCPCNDYSTCRECNTDQGCVFCGTNNTCVSSATVGKTCSFLKHTCPCSDNVDCQSCNDDYDCQWCDDKKGECLTASANNCSLVAHSCPAAKAPRHFDAASFIGGIVLGAGILAIVGGIILCVAWNRRRKYQPL